MKETLRQYGAAYIAAFIVVFTIGIIATVKAVTPTGKSVSGIYGIAGAMEEEYLQEAAEQTEGTAAAVSEITEREAAKVETEVAKEGVTYEARELIKSESGDISVISVEKDGVKCRASVVDAGGRLTFPEGGRYIIRYLITDDAAGREGARRTGNICIFVRGIR